MCCNTKPRKPRSRAAINRATVKAEQAREAKKQQEAA